MRLLQGPFQSIIPVDTFQFLCLDRRALGQPRRCDRTRSSAFLPRAPRMLAHALVMLGVVIRHSHAPHPHL